MIAQEPEVYPTQPKPLRQHVTQLLNQARTEAIDGEILALIVPDTNELRSGPVAAEVYKLLQDRAYDTIILISPSHTGPFGRLHICSVDTYRSPLGDVPVNDRMRNELCDEDDDIFLDDEGHFQVEGVDVQLPFLQTLLAEFDIVPIVMGDETPALCRELGHAVGEVMYNRRTLVVASMDLIEASAEMLDAFTTHVEALDIDRLMALMNSNKIEALGHGALLVALIAAKHRRGSRARVLQLEAPADEAPGFAGIAVWRG